MQRATLTLTAFALAALVGFATAAEAMRCEGGEAGCEQYTSCHEIRQMIDGSIRTAWSWSVSNQCDNTWEMASGIDCYWG